MAGTKQGDLTPAEQAEGMILAKKADAQAAAAAKKKIIEEDAARVRKTESDLKSVKAQIKLLEKEKTYQQKQYNAYRTQAAIQLAANSLLTPPQNKTGSNTAPTGQTYARWWQLVGEYQGQYDVAETLYKRNVKSLFTKQKLLDTQLFRQKRTLEKDKTGKTSVVPTVDKTKNVTVIDTKNDNVVVATAPIKLGAYVYQAPMVSSNYFTGLQKDILNGNLISPGSFNDALNFWKYDKDGKPIVGRGTIQADRQNSSNAGKIAEINKTQGFKGDLDKNLYGFKFLYNPETVDMNWGSINNVDPVYESLKLDPFAPGTTNLMASQLSFNLVINRISDLSLFDVSSPGDVNVSRVASLYPAWTPPTGSDAVTEVKKILEKGTMYDIEYLFKAMFGISSYSQYKSWFSGETTSDPGWLPVWPVELHLGNGLRYRVRINSLAVHHSIFSPRMIPVLSTISLSCSRYYELSSSV
jgi:hypothetical protein